MKILVVFGTRPEAIKMAPLVQELYAAPKVETIVCVTGQHRAMLDQVLAAFSIEPEYDLSIMKPGQSLSEITQEILQGLDQILVGERPDLVLVHGDTTTSFASAVAAFHRGIPVGHVEAGLRTHDFQSPFPEEFNRQAIDLVSKYYFAPTELARENLLAERKSPTSIFVTGNTAIDALKTTVRDDYSHSLLDWVGNHRLILLTAHRRENLGAPMRSMLHAVKRIAQEYADVRILYPMHKNPHVRSVAQSELGSLTNVRLVEPLDVVDFHNVMARSYLILTDSGGIQEEAPSLGVPVLVMRNTTERPEGVEAGTLRLVGTGEDAIYRACVSLLGDAQDYASMSSVTNPYGDGNASQRIVSAIIAEFGLSLDMDRR